MNLKLKFLQQQILTIIGVFSILVSIFFSIHNNEYLLFALSILYSHIIVFFFGTQIVLHRYYSHRSFQTNKFFKNLFLFLSFLPGQGSPIAWSAAHRHHHKYSDKELDNHSPIESYFLAAGGWLLKGYDWVIGVKKLKTIPTDLLRDKILVTIDKNYYIIWWTAIMAGLTINYKITFFFLLAPVGWTILFSALVTLGCHIKIIGSYRNFDINDNTQNNILIQLLVLGDALHNNHHKNPGNYDTKIKKYEFDLAATIIKCIAKN
jgi:stearoyl-CoA desaturase (delta-9 desaturase)